MRFLPPAIDFKLCWEVTWKIWNNILYRSVSHSNGGRDKQQIRRQYYNRLSDVEIFHNLIY